MNRDKETERMHLEKPGMVSTAEIRAMFGEEPLRLDGKRLCPGCEEVFVLDGYCPECRRLLAEYAQKEAEARKGRLFAALPRLDAGVGEFTEVRPSQRFAADALLAIGGAALGFFLSPVLFVLGKAAIAWLLGVSR